MRKWVDENPAQHNANSDRWRRKAQQQGYYQQEHVKERMRSYYRKKKGVPTATRPCPTLCENCLQSPGKRGMHLDHDHDTGAFRGWLCGRCNMGLGALGDTIATIERLLAYLRRAGRAPE